jgi:hypothetical protein
MMTKKIEAPSLGQTRESTLARFAAMLKGLQFAIEAASTGCSGSRIVEVVGATAPGLVQWNGFLGEIVRTQAGIPATSSDAVESQSNAETLVNVQMLVPVNDVMETSVEHCQHPVVSFSRANLRPPVMFESASCSSALGEAALKNASHRDLKRVVICLTPQLSMAISVDRNCGTMAASRAHAWPTSRLVIGSRKLGANQQYGLQIGTMSEHEQLRVAQQTLDDFTRFGNQVPMEMHCWIEKVDGNQNLHIVDDVTHFDLYFNSTYNRGQYQAPLFRPQVGLSLTPANWHALGVEFSPYPSSVQEVYRKFAVKRALQNLSQHEKSHGFTLAIVQDALSAFHRQSDQRLIL